MFYLFNGKIRFYKYKLIKDNKILNARDKTQRDFINKNNDYEVFEIPINYSQEQLEIIYSKTFNSIDIAIGFLEGLEA